MTDHDPRAAACAALVHMHTTVNEALADKDATVGDVAYAFQAASITGGQAAMVHNGLYTGDQIAALAEQQRLANVIAAFAAGYGQEDNYLDASYDDAAAAADYVRARIRDIVRPAKALKETA